MGLVFLGWCSISVAVCYGFCLDVIVWVCCLVGLLGWVLQGLALALCCVCVLVTIWIGFGR